MQILCFWCRSLIIIVIITVCPALPRISKILEMDLIFIFGLGVLILCSEKIRIVD